MGYTAVADCHTTVRRRQCRLTWLVRSSLCNLFQPALTLDNPGYSGMLLVMDVAGIQLTRGNP